jgi:hypothetical protein
LFGGDRGRRQEQENKQGRTQNYDKHLKAED